MKIVPSEWYGPDYWMGRHTYKSADGSTHIYAPPALTWDGFQYVADTLAALCPSKSVLDIGCGGGDLAYRFEGHGLRPYGIDISEFAIQNCVQNMRGRLALADITACPKELWAHQAPNWDNDARGEGYEFPFPDQYDLVMATDLLEHIYQEDLDKTFQWMVDRSKRWLFFCVATTTHENHKQEFVHTKGEPIPLEWEATAVSGHVNVRHWTWWVHYFEKQRLAVRWDLGYQLQTARESIGPWRDTMGWQMPNTWILEK